MSGPDRCYRCGTALHRDDGDGSLRCANGHTQPDPDGRSEYAQVVENLRDLRAMIEEDVIPGLRSLREEVEALRAERSTLPESLPSDELVDLAAMARRLKVSPDWLRRHAAELGGRQSKKGGPWKFNPAFTMARFGSSQGERTATPATVHQPRPLPSKVELLPVKDQAA